MSLGPRRGARPAPAAAPADPRGAGVGRAADAAALDVGQLRPDGRGQPAPPGAGRLALVRRLAIRVRASRRQSSSIARRRSTSRPRAGGRSRWDEIVAGSDGEGDGDRYRACASAFAVGRDGSAVAGQVFVHAAVAGPGGPRGGSRGGDRPDRTIEPVPRPPDRSARLLLLVALSAGCSRTSPSRHDDRPIPADRVLDFATLYAQNCAGCHGADGQFGPAPPLNDPLFLAIVPDAVLSMIVDEGRPGTPMPAFSRRHGGPLTDEQVKAIADGIKPRWKADRSGPSPPAYARRPGAMRAAAGRSSRGRAPRATARKGAGARSKVGPIHDPAFLALISDQAIRRFVITGRRDLKMPDFAGKDGRPDDFQAPDPGGRRRPRRAPLRLEGRMIDHAPPDEHPPRRRNFFRWVTYGLGAAASAVVALAVRRLHPRREAEAGRLGRPRPRRRLRRGRDPARHLRQPAPPAVGRHGGAYRGLRPSRGRARVSSRSSP